MRRPPRLPSTVVAALMAGSQGCLVLLEHPVYRIRADVPAIDQGRVDDVNGTDAFTMDGGVGDTRGDTNPTVDVVHDVLPTNDPIPLPDAIGAEGSAGDATAGYVGPAASSCAAATASPPSATYTGTTCGGTDALTLSCNPGAHTEIAIRIDGLPGQIWDIVPSAGLAEALYLGTECGATPLACGSGSSAGGGMISDGPFPTTRTDYLVFEANGDAGCVSYRITVMLR